MDKKLGVIVPYRDRYEQLIIFKRSIQNYLISKKINYELIIVEQDDAKNFNRGKLLNIGFLKAKYLKCNYVVFHDVDMLPIDVDYSYSDYPVHLATNFICDDENFNRIVFDEYFGGVTIFPMDIFEQINGFSNEYWGWGYEDTDLLYRCRVNNVYLNTKEYKQLGGQGAALNFNGKNSSVITNTDFFKNNKQITIFVSFSIDDLILNSEKYDDEFVIFSIDSFKIKYNSYQRYIVQLKDDAGEYSHVSSQIKPPYKTNILTCIDLIENKLIVYQDGELLGESVIKNNFQFESDNFYLGCDSDGNHFSGLIDSLAIYYGILNENEIDSISKNQHFGLTQSFDKYKSQDLLKFYFDAKFTIKNEIINLINPTNNGLINNCVVVKHNFEDTKTLEVPYRRNCTFKLLPHEENGFVGSSWKHITTRYNQLKYQNEVLKNRKNIRKEGLNSCEFKQHDIFKIDKTTHIIVGI